MKLIKSELSVAVATAVFGLALTACGHHHHNSDNNSANTEAWLEESGSDATLVETIDESTLPEMEDACKVDGSTVIVNITDAGLDWESYGLYMYGADEAAGGWPGADVTEAGLAGCTKQTILALNPFDLDAAVANKSVLKTDDGTSSAGALAGYNAILNNLNQGKQTADPPSAFSKINTCLKVSPDLNDEGKNLVEVLSGRECGVHVEGVSDNIEQAYIVYKNGDDNVVYGDGSTLEFTEKLGDDKSKYVEVALLLKGIGINESTTGYYWIDDDEANKKPFTNGLTLKIGENVTVEDGATKTAVLHVQYVASDADGNETEVASSAITIVKSYVSKDAESRLNKPAATLGATYASDKTVFRIWSPDSSDVKVNVDGTDYDMKLSSIEGYTKVYEVSVDGDLAGKTYQFTVGGKKVRDPYGRMVANGNDTANIVMDMSKTDPEGGWADAPALKNREDSVVYEVHVRDFTIDKTSGVDSDKRGRYLGMVQTGTTYSGVATGIDHLKELGVTHVQLQPIYDYGTCSDVDSQDDSCYNWGYDPWNYNVPEDRYSSAFGTANYDQKIQEVKTMINEFHKNGIRVIMDVVYNHTWNKTVFQDITSKYYNKDDLSGCGNSIDAVNDMVWKMIRDSMDYWVTEFHVDGFRLDLVGAFSMEDYSDWGVYLNKVHPDANLLIYGEPWSGGSGSLTDNALPVRPGRIHLQDENAHVGSFNNRIRNCIRGGSGNNADNPGFLFDKLNNNSMDDNGSFDTDTKIASNKDCVLVSMQGGARHSDATGTDEWTAQAFVDPEQSVSYLTCHDNMALRDYIEDFLGETNTDKVRKLQAYANSIVTVSQGISFIHGGEEIGRTKAAAGKDIDNSYNTTTGANDFKWDLKAGDWKAVSDSYAAHVKMRKEHPAFRMTTADQIFENVTIDDANSTESVVIININGEAVKDSWTKIKVVLNSSGSAFTVPGVSDMTKVAAGNNVGVDNVLNNDKAEAQAVSIWAVVSESGGGDDAEAPFDDVLCLKGEMTQGPWNCDELTWDSDVKAYLSDVYTLSASQEFLVTVGDNWLDPNTYAVKEDGVLCPKSDGCSSNVKVGKDGDYVFKFVPADGLMNWELLEETPR